MNAFEDATLLRHLRLELDDAGIAWLGFDVLDSSVNHLSTPVLREFDKALDDIDAVSPKGLIIYSAKPAGFIAGADVDELASLASKEQGMALIARGHGVFNRLARRPYPTLALIEGHCLGGGLELALACRYRLAVDHPDTRFALPEVRIGIVPAWGGMERLPTVIGARAALDFMLTGRSIDALHAKRLGMVDDVVPKRLARAAAARTVLGGRPSRRAQGVAALMNNRLLRIGLAQQALKQVDARDPHHHYQAPRALLEIWREHQGKALDAPDVIGNIIDADTTHHLLRVQRLSNRLKRLGKLEVSPPPVTRVHVVGAGTMGGDIASWCASQGLTVTLQDTDRQAIARAQGRAYRFISKRLQPAWRVQASMDRLIPDPEGHGAAKADVVIEAITEDLQAKQAIYSQLELRTRPDALLATNTSSIPIQALRMQLARPQRLIGLHFFNPVTKMPLVEVVQTEDLGEEVRARGLAFVHQIGKLPLPVASTPGFLVNASLAPYLMEAMHCVDEGIRPETIDAAMEAYGMPIGPLELADIIGLDIVRDTGMQLAPGGMPACLLNHLSRNDLGRKTGRGFYTWPDPERPAKMERDPIPANLAQRLLHPMIEKAQALVDAGVVADADLADAGLIFGAGFPPFTGGPLHYRNKHERRRRPHPVPADEPGTAMPS